MKSETSKIYLQHLLASSLSKMKLSDQLERIEISVPDAKFGDYSTNIALALSKKLKLSPLDIANKLVEVIKTLDIDLVFSNIEVANGFINFTLAQNYLLENLHNVLKGADNFGSPWNNEDKTVIVEYFQNNVAKPPHVGHLRSAVVGDSLLRIFRFLGYNAISDTHIGDWGTQFGFLLYAFKDFIKNGGKKEQIEADPINELNKLYVAASSKWEEQKTQLLEDNEESVWKKATQEFLKLEEGDKENRELWKWFVDESLKDFERYRKLLGLLEFDNNLGESFYEDKMPAVLKELETKGLVKIGETGEKYVDLEAYSMGRCILVKSDGATTYHLRDFATYIYRKSEFKFWKNIYVVDNRQAHHFKQLFKILELAGYSTAQDCTHVELGFMSLPEGPISTRKGNIISLQNLVDEAEKRALSIIEEKNPELKNKTEIAAKVARASIKYFDLVHNRKTEFVFTWEKALSFEGNTGPYMQYTHARIYGILRKSENKKFVPEPVEGQIFSDKLSHSTSSGNSLSISPLELFVLRKLNQFPEILELVAQDYLPNLLCNYLFELSQSFNSFYQEIPVLKEPDELLKAFRLKLITATAQVIKNGLGLLGIEAPEEM